MVPIDLSVGMAQITTALAIRADRTTRTVLTDGVWGSDNTSVATVRSTLGSPWATIEAVGVGTATIFVDAEGVRGTIPVNVSEECSNTRTTCDLPSADPSCVQPPCYVVCWVSRCSGNGEGGSEGAGMPLP